jgi:hypothetical protein
LIAATHTHSGAETSFLFGCGPDDPELLDIETQIADSLVCAWDDRSPVSFSWGVTHLNMTHNRRVLNAEGRAAMALEYVEGETRGPVDPDLLTLCFTSPGGQTKAVLCHYTAHPLTLGPGNDLYSADYPGRACRILEESLPGCTALFFNGAAGNVHPRQCMRPDPSALTTVGDAVGEAALKAVRCARCVSATPLRLVSDHLGFSNRLDPALRASVEINVLKIGSVTLGFVPGEFFVEFQERFKEAIAPSPGTLVGYANGWPGYVPTREAYAQGGYGVDRATCDPARYSRTALPAGAGEAILDRLMALTRS